jgi:hypothetical protein
MTPLRCIVWRTNHLASVSLGLCRAAGGRWRAGAIAALQIPSFTGTRYQSKERPHALGLTRKDLPSVVALTAGRLRTEKPNEIKGVAVVAVVAVQNTTPRSTSPADAQPRCPAAGRWCRCWWPGTVQGGEGVPRLRVLPSRSRVRAILTPTSR